MNSKVSEILDIMSGIVFIKKYKNTKNFEARNIGKRILRITKLIICLIVIPLIEVRYLL